ncbi:hypothetical protein L596_012671 [Steinernema carpocapsae]|uniref:Uncharacterized protein n=1 Tax=Steinernema carpocapsae TaxID=34508 RepID=A0A4U5NXX2_STECR|nr:hypothetical protein L596_012671 [Steinernema carpocapsae]
MHHTDVHGLARLNIIKSVTAVEFDECIVKCFETEECVGANFVFNWWHLTRDAKLFQRVPKTMRRTSAIMAREEPKNCRVSLEKIMECFDLHPLNTAT